MKMRQFGDQASRLRVQRGHDEGGQSLATRRAWFGDGDAAGQSGTGSTTPPGGTSSTNGQDPNAGGTTPQDVGSLPSWAQKMITDLRSEAADRRTQLRQRESEEQARLAKLGEWETLAKGQAQKVADLEPRALRAESLDAFVRESLTARIATIPEAMRSLVPSFPDPLDTIKWLDANERLLRQPVPPSMDAGAGSDGARGAAPLTDEEKAMAAALGIDPAKMAKMKQGGK